MIALVIVMVIVIVIGIVKVIVIAIVKSNSNSNCKNDIYVRDVLRSGSGAASGFGSDVLSVYSYSI